MLIDKVESLKEKAKLDAEKLRQLNTRIKFLEHAAKAESTKQTRKNEARQKILAGAFVLDAMSKNEPIRLMLEKKLDDYLVRDVDRKVFGLPVTATTEKVKTPNFDDVLNSVL
jgi:uncharacterized protein (DUF342 family)